MDEIDQLNSQDDVDLSEVSTDYPLLPKGTYRFLVAEAKIVDGKSREGSKVFEAKLTLNQQARSTKGVDIAPGFPLTYRIGLTPTEKYSQDAIRTAQAKFMEATVGHKGRWMPLEQYIGCEVTANLKIKKTEEFGERNEFTSLLKK